MHIKIGAALAAVSMMAAAGAASAQQAKLTRNDVGSNCAQVFSASQQGSTKSAPLTFVNTTAGSVFVAWMDFSGVANVLAQLAPAQRFDDTSRPGHVYIVLDGNLNCLAGFQLLDPGVEIVLN